MRGYFESNNAQEHCLQATLYHMPHSFMRLFITLLVYFPLANPKDLWLKFQSSRSKDFHQQSNIPPEQVQLKVLYEIRKFLQSIGKIINSYSLVSKILKFNEATAETRDAMTKTQIEVSYEDLSCINHLNTEQRVAFDTIIEAI